MAFSQLTHNFDDIISPDYYPVHGFLQHPDNASDLFKPAHQPVYLFTQLTYNFDDILNPDHYPVHGFSQHPDNYGDLFNPAHYPVNGFFTANTRLR